MTTILLYDIMVIVKKVIVKPKKTKRSKKMIKCSYKELSETAKKQARETYDNYEVGEYMVIGDVIIMRTTTVQL